MKKTIYTILALAVVAFSSCTISDKNETSANVNAAMVDPENPPIISFDSDEFNYGEIAVGTTVSHTYKFTNTGTTPLVILDVKPSCGCTALKNWPKGAIAPGESGEIPIEFTPTSAGDPVARTISVICNANPSVQKLKITGKVVGG
jgi:hypothetical protein